MSTNLGSELYTPTLLGRLGALWRWLTRPAGALQDIALRRNSQLLAAFLLIMVVLFACLNVAYYISIPNYTTPLTSIGGYIYLMVAYALNRARYYKLAAVLTVSVPPLVLFPEILTNTSANPIVTLNFLILVLLLHCE